MKEVISNQKKGFLFGNEAVVRGALESGVSFASTYPGTPASEIGDTFAAISKDAGIYFEYSANEKVALEGAAGAAFCGLRSIVSMKNYGLNVASDSLLPLVYFECPLVVVVADDPGCWSSVQTEQDSRWYSKLAHIPTLEPSNSQEVKDMTKFAFQFSAKYKIPILIRFTTRVSYSRSLVNFDKIVKAKTKGEFIKEKGGFKLGSAQTVSLHKKLLEKLIKIEKISNNSEFNFIEKGNGRVGVITTGVSFNYVKEAMQELNIKLPLLKIGFSYPFPDQKVKSFIKDLEKVIVVEELDPVIEEEVKRIAGLNNELKIYGKDLLPESNELKPEHILIAITKVLDKALDEELKKNIKNFNLEKIPKRIPFLCAGCPHRSTFYAVKKVLGEDKIFAGDIGCYMLGAYEPFKGLDFVISMGAGVGVSHGIAKASKKKPVIFIGDSTFFHAGIPALINLVYNKSDALVIVLDNRLTAMTGHQPHPGTGYTAIGEETKQIAIEDIAKACKVDFVKAPNVYNFNELVRDLKQAYNTKGVAVIVAKGECRLLTIRKMTRAGIPVPKFKITKQKNELRELEILGCPAVMKKEGRYVIDENLCWGCSLCKQLFPNYVEIVKEEKDEDKK